MDAPVAVHGFAAGRLCNTHTGSAHSSDRWPLYRALDDVTLVEFGLYCNICFNYLNVVIVSAVVYIKFESILQSK